jgi:hypothetical protein
VKGYGLDSQGSNASWGKRLLHSVQLALGSTYNFTILLLQKKNIYHTNGLAIVSMAARSSCLQVIFHLEKLTSQLLKEANFSMHCRIFPKLK